ncbi:MAG: glycosyltransferase family 2 protein [Chroococcidiopsidaceae cyanobacterium CP_BM_ER_R8_30]|nr:glycosyltransferase family 2 protein [Chroococcidiopsidaceae cyanobacterium CP_BM_ER_R8_30]
MIADWLAFRAIDLLMGIALLLIVPTFILWIECTAALFPPRRKLLQQGSSHRPKVNILIPAHNEAPILKATLEQLLPQLKDRDKLLVIADNCEDETASIARAAGVDVIERREPDRRGKGYALDYGLKFLAAGNTCDSPGDSQNSASVVLLIDADSIVHSGTVDQLACLAFATGRPVQATYLLTPKAHPEPKEAVSALAFLVKNLVRPRGLDRLGLPCLLTGTGMALPWSAIELVSLASGNIVEDMQLGLDLAIAGFAPLLCLEGRVTGALPQQQHAAKSQRTRWEHGHLQTLLTQVPRLMKAALLQKRFTLFTLALDLFVPPLSLLFMTWLVVMAVALLVGILGAGWSPIVPLVLAGTLLLLSVFGAWAKFGRANLPLSALLGIPLYVLWKVPIYFAFLVRPQSQWVRTERDVVKDI